jgi:hypothetical protein
MVDNFPQNFEYDYDYNQNPNYNGNLNNNYNNNNGNLNNYNLNINYLNNNLPLGNNNYKPSKKEEENANTKIRELENLLNQKNKEIENYKLIISRKTKLIDEKDKNINQLKQKIQDNYYKLKSQEEKYNQLKGINKDNENQILDKNNQLSKLEKEKSKINSELEKVIKSNNAQISELKSKFVQLNQESNFKQEKINQLESLNTKNKLEISNNKKAIDEFKSLLLSKDKEIENLKVEPNKLKKKNEELHKDNSTQKNKIIEKVEEINKLKEENQQLKKKIKSEENKFNNLNLDYEKIKKESNDKDTKIEKFQNETKKLENFHKLEKEINRIREYEDKSLKYQNKKKEDFYDLIIKCNSIVGLKNGWEIKMNEDGKKNYFEYKDNKFTKIGIVGSENRGKSTVLSDFSKIELPTGITIKTEGLSIKYPKLDDQFKNRKIILLDSAGLETPILKSENNEEEKEKEKMRESINAEQKENGNEGIKPEYKREEVNNIFANKSRDVIQLELFLQNFIIKYSDILILILGKLTINEQKLLLKVRTHIKNLKRKEPLIVIHNLKYFETKDQVEDYLENTLKKSSTFTLKENDEVNLENEESKWKYYFEPKAEPKIYHLIYGKKGSEAGAFYNNKTLKFIYDLITSNPDKESFDPIKCVKEYFSEISETILDNKINEDEIIDNRDINNEDGKNNANEITKIMLKDPNKKITLKKCLIDELGISNFQGNNFDAQYSYYITEKKIYVYVELPGKKEKSEDDKEYENVEVDLQTEGSFTIIKITGKKKHYCEHFTKEKIVHIQHKRQFGEFSIQVKLDKLNVDDDYQTKIENGCLLISFDIKQNSKKRKI